MCRCAKCQKIEDDAERYHAEYVETIENFILECQRDDAEISWLRDQAEENLNKVAVKGDTR